MWLYNFKIYAKIYVMRELPKIVQIVIKMLVLSQRTHRTCQWGSNPDSHAYKLMADWLRVDGTDVSGCIRPFSNYDMIEVKRKQPWGPFDRERWRERIFLPKFRLTESRWNRCKRLHPPFLKLWYDWGQKEKMRKIKDTFRPREMEREKFFYQNLDWQRQ